MSKVKVIIADDQPTFSEGLQSLLRGEDDMEPMGIASNDEEAVALVEELRPDVVIMDISMPKLNGIEATRRIKQLLPTVAVLVLSAYGYSPYVFSALEAGAAGYLLKDVPLREVLNAIRAVSIGEAVLDRGVADKVLRNMAKSWRGGVSKGTQLQQRELEVLQLGAKGLTNDEIAQQLTISPRTVQTHFTNIFNKLEVGSRLEAILHALKEGWLVLDDLR